MFIGGGLFWTSLMALDILPSAGFGSSTAPIPMSGYLALWGFFGLIPLQAGIQVSRSCRNFYGFGALFLFVLAAAPFTSYVIAYIAYAIGLVTGVSGLWAGIHYLFASPGKSLSLDRKRART